MTEVLFTGTQPTYAHEGDAGADLVTSSEVIVRHGAVTMVGTGLSIALPNGCVGLVLPRSGLGTRFGLALANTVGVIDAGFTGEIKLGLTLNQPGSLSLKKGERVAQLVIVPFMRAQFTRVSVLPDTVRGVQGFGSTGT